MMVMEHDKHGHADLYLWLLHDDICWLLHLKPIELWAYSPIMQCFVGITKKKKLTHKKLTYVLFDIMSILWFNPRYLYELEYIYI